jgi:hypothetical protein
MYSHPSISGQLAYDRQREMLAQASRLRLAREARRASLATGQAGPARRTGRLFRRARPVISPS